MTSFSRRSELELDPNTYTQAIASAQGRGTALLSLVEGNPTAVGLSLTDEQLKRVLGATDNARYAPEPFGEPSARRTIANELARRGFVVAPEQVMLTASTSEAYAYLFKLLCDPGDRVLVPSPSYPLFDMLARYEGVELVPYHLQYDGEWHLDRQELVALSRGAKAVLVVHPNNPTGHFLKRSELLALSELGLPIVSDEVFSEYALHESDERARSVLEVSERTLVFRLDGLSKSAALPQLKLAWTAIAGPAAWRDAATARLEHIADSFLSPSTPVQRALASLLGEAPPLQARIRARCATNLTVLRRALGNESAASVLAVEGGWYAIVRLPGVLDEERWALDLLERDALIVQPGYFYDLSAGAHIVLSLITPEADFAEGARRIAARVARAIA